MRAISLRMARSRPWLSSWPVADWKRRLNNSVFASASLLSSSSSVEFRNSAAASASAITLHPSRGAPGGCPPGLVRHASRTLPRAASRASGACACTSSLTNLSLHELALHRELVHGTPQCLPGHRLGHPGELEHDPPGLTFATHHSGDPLPE